MPMTLLIMLLCDRATVMDISLRDFQFICLNQFRFIRSHRMSMTLLIMLMCDRGCARSWTFHLGRFDYAYYSELG